MKPRFVGPHVRKISGSLETDREGHLVRILIVETDLCLDAQDPSYDADAVRKLVDGIKERMGDLYDRADFVQAKDA